MAQFPLLAIIILGSILVIVALFKDELISILKELIVDLAFGVLFTIVLNFFITLSVIDILVSIGCITAFVFIIHLLKAPTSTGQPGLSMH